uniref:ADP-ribosyl cyclase/cyclic ADP-ribose hydrolase n=2 Tax=Nymphaea colorata TaxID=210225 RepID=A0A5K0Y1D7_9MAGN
MEVTGGRPDLLAAFAFLLLVSVMSLVYIGRKITVKQGHPSECGSEKKEEVAQRKAVDNKAGPSTKIPEQDSMNFYVVISFRGEDTRKGFTSHLHKELRSRGITTFIDSERLEKGPRINDLFKCIEESKIFVPIFSKNYADSTWCLKEIAKMVDVIHHFQSEVY